MRKTVVVLFPAFVAVIAAASTPQQRGQAVSSDELLPDEKIQQVLNRFTFGAHPGDADRVRAMGIDKWIDWQLHPERIDDQAADEAVSKYSIFSMKTQDVVGDFNRLQQLQRQAKQAAGNDTTMNKPEIRREVAAQNPQ